MVKRNKNGKEKELYKKWCISRIVKVKVIQSCPTLCDPMDSPWNSSGQNTGVSSHSLPQGHLPHSEIEPRSPTSQEDSLPVAPPGKPISSIMISIISKKWSFHNKHGLCRMIHCVQWRCTFMLVKKKITAHKMYFWTSKAPGPQMLN